MTGTRRSGEADATFDAVHAPILLHFPDLVMRLGGNLRHLLALAGMDPRSFAGEAPQATYRQLIALMEVAATELACPDFGMRLAELQGGEGMFGPLGSVMRNSRTYGAAMDYVWKHTYAHSLAAHIWRRRLPEEGLVFSGHDILIDGIAGRAQAVEQIMLAGHLSACALTGGHARVRRVHFRHQPVSAPEVYRRHFGCEVRFGQHEDGVAFSERDLACPIVSPDASGREQAAAYIDRSFTRHRPPAHAEARGAIMRLIGTGDCSNARVADELNLHLRTLHRRLREEGTSFQQVKDEVRRDMMRYYLQRTALDFTRISEKLGFAEQSVMARSCRRWFAKSPTEMRGGLSRAVKP